MPTYNVTLTADGFPSVSLGSMLNQLTLTSGSRDGIEQPNPSNLSITFLGSPSLSGTTYPASWWLGKAITVTIAPSDTTDYIYWTGYVAVANVQAEDTAGNTVTVSLTAYSGMQTMQRDMIDLTLVPPVTGTVVERIIQAEADSTQLAWLEFDGTTSWGLIPSTYKWSTIDTIRPHFDFQYDATGITSPLNPYTSPYGAGLTNFLDYMQAFASSCNSWFYEIAKNGTHRAFWQIWRKDTAVTPTTLDLTTCVTSQSLRADIDVSRLINEFTFVQSNDNTTTTIGDIASIQQYGYRPLTYTLENIYSANLGQNILYRYSQPYTALSSLEIIIDQLPASEKINFMFAGANNRYAFTGIPSTFGGNGTYELRGSNLNLSYETAVATVTVVPNKFWILYTAWWAVGSNPWSTYATASTKWQDIV